MKTRGIKVAAGFTLLEVLVALTILAVAAAIASSLISGSLGKIRKVQLRTKIIEHAEAVMEETLLDDTILDPTVLTGDFEDGTRWTVSIERYELPLPAQQESRNLQQNMSCQLLQYTVDMLNPDSQVSNYRLQTLKLTKMPVPK
jgi:prepilin-type N-terminal cleavage/methylation domain-containing protein